MPRQETITLYQFSELSDRAKETARDWWRAGGLDYDWWDAVYDDFTTILEKLGYSVDPKDISFSGFWSQGDGASFAGSYAYRKGAAKDIRAYAGADTTLHALADRLQAMQRRNFYQVTGHITTSGRYCHEMTMQCDVDRYDGADWSSETYGDAQAEFQGVSRDLARWLYRTLEAECTYLMSDESIAEAMEANKYEFTRDGKFAA